MIELCVQIHFNLYQRGVVNSWSIQIYKSTPRHGSATFERPSSSLYPTAGSAKASGIHGCNHAIRFTKEHWAGLLQKLTFGPGNSLLGVGVKVRSFPVHCRIFSSNADLYLQRDQWHRPSHDHQNVYRSAKCRCRGGGSKVAPLENQWHTEHSNSSPKVIK